MTSQQLIDLISSLIYLTVELSLPLLGSALLIGLLVSIFQAATQINESTLSFLPKMAVILLVFLMCSPWIIRKMKDYTRDTFSQITQITKAR